jgi:hypothetical protein
VQAIGIDETERTISRETKTDAEGRYRLADSPTPAAYLVRARYGEIVFPGGSAVFRPGEPEIEHAVDFEIFDPSRDGSRLRLASLQWVIERSAGAWRVRQTAVVANPERAVVLVPDDQPAPLALALAPGHGEVSGTFGRLPQGVTIRDGVAEIRGPVLPGDDGLSFELVYDVDAPADEFEAKIALPSPAEQLAVYVQDFGIDVDAGALHPPARAPDDGSTELASSVRGSERSVRVRALPLHAVAEVWSRRRGAARRRAVALRGRASWRSARGPAPEPAAAEPRRAALGRRVRDLSTTSDRQASAGTATGREDLSVNATASAPASAKRRSAGRRPHPHLRRCPRRRPLLRERGARSERGRA